MSTTTDQLDVIAQMYAAGHLPPRARRRLRLPAALWRHAGKVAEFLRTFGREAPDSVVTQLWCQANAYEALWRYDHDKPNEECTWLVVKRPTDAAFRAVVDVEEGEGKPRLRKRA